MYKLISISLGFLLLVAGCSDEGPVTVDPDASDPAAWFDGSFDGEALVLQRTDVAGPDGTLVPVDLVATSIEYDAASRQLSAAVHLRNASRVELYAPAQVGVDDFLPESIVPINADWIGRAGQAWWYDYTEALGDGVLSPGETSEGVTWILQLPGPGSFAFSAVATFSPVPNRPVIAGRVFQDLDRDGEPDPDEPGAFGQVEVVFPGGRRLLAQPTPDGRWRVPVIDTGIHEVTWISPPTMSLVPVCLTTPNPLVVFLTPGPDGGPQSFVDANFGVDPEPCIPGPDLPIRLSDVPLDSLASAPWTLIDLAYLGPDPAGGGRIEFRVGYGGCQPNHPLALVLRRPGADSDPSRIEATLQHDDRGELCDAWFTVTRAVDALALRRLWLEESGYQGPLVLVIHTPDGEARELALD